MFEQTNKRTNDPGLENYYSVSRLQDMFLLHPDIFLWDFLILLGMTIALAGGVGCLILRKRHPKKRILGLFGLLGLFGFFLIVYAAFIEPRTIVINHQTLHHPQGREMTVVVASDVHVGPYKGKAFLKRAVDAINAQLPDIVLLPGDFIFTRNADLSDLDPLQDVRAAVGVYAVLGNHDVGQYRSLSGTRYSGFDRGEKIAQKLADLGVTVLRNEHVEVSLPDGSIAVAGIDDLWTGHHDLPAALDTIAEHAFSILLSHNPSVIKEPRGHDAHLIVSGHTHGGQIRLPGIGPLTQLPTNLGPQYDQGLFSIDDDSTLAITRGIGETHSRMRLFAWPEVLVIDIHNS